MPADYLIVDTDAFSYLFGKKPQAASYGPLLSGKIPAVAFVTLAEVRFGALAASWGDRRTTELEASLRQFLMLPFTEDLTTSRPCGPDSKPTPAATVTRWLSQNIATTCGSPHAARTTRRRS